MKLRLQGDEKNLVVEATPFVVLCCGGPGKSTCFTQGAVPLGFHPWDLRAL